MGAKKKKKGRNGMDLKKAENIKKKWQEYTKELYKNWLYSLQANKEKL